MPVSLLVPQFLAFAFVRRPGYIIVQSQFLLLSRRRTFQRDPRAHPTDLPPSNRADFGRKPHIREGLRGEGVGMAPDYKLGLTGMATLRASRMASWA